MFYSTISLGVASPIFAAIDILASACLNPTVGDIDAEPVDTHHDRGRCGLLVSACESRRGAATGDVFQSQDFCHRSRTKRADIHVRRRRGPIRVGDRGRRPPRRLDRICRPKQGADFKRSMEQRVRLSAGAPSERESSGRNDLRPIGEPRHRAWRWRRCAPRGASASASASPFSRRIRIGSEARRSAPDSRHAGSRTTGRC